jgi:hypothetical protein
MFVKKVRSRCLPQVVTIELWSEVKGKEDVMRNVMPSGKRGGKVVE